ncbi:ABC transporter ATP-binding protein [Cohnella mopanensis]|uniref:ABC transporter ATP-binding protein n=1 Tax=Cohnella mopanensis TaxID=2911966 RepID=UPI001EF889AC|nr:ABC transporter ATP-binding protein [Cohnella mopanensis]
MNNPVVLQVNELSIRVQGAEEEKTEVVQNVSFQIRSGQVLGVVGESGSGKSMTCMSILGLLPPTAKMTRGNIVLNDRSLTALTPRQLRGIRGREISLVLQNPMTAFNPVVTIGKQFIETLRAHQPMGMKVAKRLAIDALGKMTLQDPEKVMQQYPFELSGGMLQRVMIALSLSLNPSLLIADEPTTALDPVNKNNVIEMIRAIKKQGKTAILLVSHDLDVIGALADVVAVMKEGRIVEIAPVDELFIRPKHEYTKLLLDARLFARNWN